MHLETKLKLKMSQKIKLSPLLSMYEPELQEHQHTQAFQSSPKADDPVKKLKQIKEMLDAGLINQTEYDSKKTELLSRM